MSITGIDKYQQAFAAQLFGGQTALGQNIGTQGTIPQAAKRVEGVGAEVQGAQKFDWKNLSKFDSVLSGVQTQAQGGKAVESPTGGVSEINIFGGEKAAPQGAYGIEPKGGNGLFASLNALDAKDLGLNGQRAGLDGQKHLNLIA